MPGPFTPEQQAQAAAFYADNLNAGTIDPATGLVTGAPPVDVQSVPRAPAPTGLAPYVPPPPAAPPPAPPPMGAVGRFQADQAAGRGYVSPYQIAATAQPTTDHITPILVGSLGVLGAAGAHGASEPPPAAPAGPPPAAPPPAPPPAAPTISIPTVEIADHPARPAVFGGGGGANPDPFHLRADQRRLLGTYDTEADAMRAGANAEATRGVVRAEHMERLAQRQEEDAAIEHAAAEEESRVMQSHVDEAQRQLDAVREQRIDPLAGMHDTGTKVLAVVGGLLGGLYQGITRGPSNPFLDQLNKTIDRSIDVQERNIANQRAGATDQLNLLKHQRDVFKDNALARLQTRQLYYEAAKQSIEAQSATFDSEIVKQRAEQGVAGISREQAKLQMQIDQASASAAAAAAAAVRAQQKAAQDRIDKIYETYYAHYAKDYGPEVAEAEAARAVERLGLGQSPTTPHVASGAHADVLSSVPKPQLEAATKELEARAQADKGLAQLDTIFRKYAALPATAGPWDREREALKSAAMGAYKQALGPGMSSDKDAETFLEPLMPQYGSSDKMNAEKLALVKAQIDSKVATPILDRHNPGWRGPAPTTGIQHYNADGSPK